ncbi:hypothetical protein AAFP30_12835 [Gordonia sp. CPCC 205515]|uniref:hypothetical protein n=1 Tax=Gordonia sp. CPCC 205515 TaxID=3140791 RepID=UPI003AF3A2A6
MHDVIEIRQTLTVVAFLQFIGCALVTVLMLSFGLRALANGAISVGGYVFILAVIGIAGTVQIGRDLFTRTLIARIDFTGVTFGRIRDPQFCHWSWTEIAYVESQTTRLEATPSRYLLFHLVASDRTAALSASGSAGPGRSRFMRQTQLGRATMIKFTAGMRPDLDETVAQLRVLAPMRVVTRL